MNKWMQSADLGWNGNITNLLKPAIRKQSPSDKLHIYKRFSEESNLHKFVSMIKAENLQV